MMPSPIITMHAATATVSYTIQFIAMQFLDKLHAMLCRLQGLHGVLIVNLQLYHAISQKLCKIVPKLLSY